MSISKAMQLPAPKDLLRAYAEGYFPMPDPQTQEILWFRPEPRAILPLDKFHRSKSLVREIQKADFTVSYDTAFVDVMEACALRKETWITDEFKRRYTELYRLGNAHCVEIWSKNKELIGGVYGVHLASAFFAESMFHKQTNASKIALFYLVEKLKNQGFRLLEVQFLTPHLKGLGAEEVSDIQYQKLLNRALHLKADF